MEPGSPPMSARARTPVRWGIGDFFIVYFAGLACAVIGGALGATMSGQVAGDDPNAATTAGTLFGTYIGYSVSLWLVSKYKGRASLADDFGLRVRTQYWWVLIAGGALQFALGALVYPLIWLADDEKQSIVEALQDASGPKKLVLAVTAGLLAPVFEEIIFRGLLLRSLRRRLPVEWAVVIQALVFAAIHLTDPKLGTLAIVPALFALGAISGVAAVRTGDLSVSIPLHMGFNLVTVVTLAMLH